MSSGKAMKVLLLGAGGQLATALMPELERTGHHVVGLTHAECDLTDPAQIERSLDRNPADALINAAAFNLVDRCETEIEAAFQANGYGPRALARSCERRGLVLVHVSTNYVFDGRRPSPPLPYDEEASPNPLSVYGLSKLAGERFVQTHCRKHFVVRSGGLYGRYVARSSGENFVERVLVAAASGSSAGGVGGGTPLRIVSDQIVTPTYTGHLALAIVELLSTTAYGLYHVTNGGCCSWWEFAQAVVNRAGLSTVIESITSEAYQATACLPAGRAPRPAYSVLANRAFSALGLTPLPDWTRGLDAYFHDREASEIGVRFEF
jgi:dTDP-4-dehydrorhamnose reductase